MSVARRVLSGSLASWARIVVTIGTQLALVPVFLSHWSVPTYGCWLVIQAVAAFTGMFSLAHHNYVGNVMLQTPERSPLLVGTILSAALPFSVALGVLELGLLSALAGAGTLSLAFDVGEGVDAPLLSQALVSLLVVCGSTFLCVVSSGLYGRVATTYGHFARTAWWGVAIAATSALGCAAMVAGGAGLLATALGTSALNLALYGAYHVDLWRLARRHHVRLCTPDWAQGSTRLLASLQLGLSYVLGLVRQQGMRVLVSSTLGVAQAVSFSTLRTASNLAQQGVATVVDPVFPELMGFIRDRRTAEVIGSIAFVWIAVVFLLGPLLVLLQVAAPLLFDLWTRGKVPFDAAVFAMFSAGMLVFALARPAESIVFGSNMLRVQLATSASLATLTVLGIYGLGGRFGLHGVAAVLLGAETVGATIVLYWARRRLAAQGMSWPQPLFLIALAQALLCAAGIAALVAAPTHAVAVVGIVVAGTTVLLAMFLERLPTAQKTWLRQRASRWVPSLDRA